MSKRLPGNVVIAVDRSRPHRRRARSGARSLLALPPRPPSPRVRAPRLPQAVSYRAASTRPGCCYAGCAMPPRPSGPCRGSHPPPPRAPPAPRVQETGPRQQQLFGKGRIQPLLMHNHTTRLDLGSSSLAAFNTHYGNCGHKKFRPHLPSVLQVPADAAVRFALI